MTTLRTDVLRMPSARIGPLNPLPPLVRTGDPHDGLPPELDDAAMVARVAYGHLPSMLPYLVQDGYDRTRTDQDHRTAVLENDILRATFLLDRGGRLWSLIHKPTGRELLYRNTVFQPGNLALRNAWFAGGAEWNLGTTGHSPLTCEPMHAVRVDGESGPVLRMYEYERSRGLFFSIDFSLPEGSAVLLAAVRVTNPTSSTVPLYWWTNIAVPQSDDVRVIAPAAEAFHYAYDRGLHVVPVPQEEGGRDLSYPATAPGAADWFFDCRAAARPWVAAIDGAGAGLVHVSTDRLVGRKLFAWGRSVGGENWQSLLCGDGERYLEIQGGLATTQFEHEELAAGETCAWVEAFGLAALAPESVHGEWPRALRALETVTEDLIPRSVLDDEVIAAERRAARAPAEVLNRGSGWGALEERRRELAGEPRMAPEGLPFSADTLGEQQAAWTALLETGALPARDPQQAPSSSVVGAEWSRLVEASGDDWSAWLHRGLVRWHAGDRSGAYAATERSVERSPTAWALRNLAVMDRVAGRRERSVEHYRAARRHAPRLRPLLIETLVALIEGGHPGEALQLIDDLGPDDRAVRRIMMIELRAAIAAGDEKRAAGLFAVDPIPDDLQEGEDSLSALWRDFHEIRGTSPVPELPPRLDYRMG